MERYGKECQEVTNNENRSTCDSLKNSYGITTASKFPSSGNRTTNSVREDYNEATSKTFRDFDKKVKVFDSKFTTKDHCSPDYFGITESESQRQSQEPLESVSKNDQYTAHGNICTNELFTASHKTTDISIDVHSSAKHLEKETKFPKRQKQIMEPVQNRANSCFSRNGDVPVKNLNEKYDETVIYSKLMPKFSSVSLPELKRNHNESLVRDCSDSDQLQHFSVVMVPDRNACSSLSPSIDNNSAGASWKSKKFKPSTENNDSKLQTVSMTSNLLLSKGHTPTENKSSNFQSSNMTVNGPCRHCYSPNKKSAHDDEPSCRICHSVTDLETLVSPCLCTGSMKYVHESCLLNWLKSSMKTNCELCVHEVRVKKLVKPLREWRFLDEKPVAIIWLLSFLILLTLNILSVIKDASRGCSSTTCIVFYVLGSTGAILGVIFLWFWAKKSAVYFKKLLTLNQIWLLEETYANRKNLGKTVAVDCGV